MEAIEPQKSFLYDTLLPKVEKLGLIVTALGFVSAFMHIGRFETLMILGIGTLSVVAFLCAYKPAASSSDEVNCPSQYFNNDNIPYESLVERNFLLDTLAPKVVSIAGACVLIGMLFKIEVWNGANIQLLVGEIPLVFFVGLMALNQRIDRRAALLAILGGAMLFISSETLLQQLHSDDPKLVELMVNQLHHPHDRAANEALRTYQHEKRIQR